MTTALSIANRTAFGQRVFVRDCQSWLAKPKAHVMRMSMTMCMAGRMHKSHFFAGLSRIHPWTRQFGLSAIATGVNLTRSTGILSSLSFQKTIPQIGWKKRSIFRSNPNRSAQTIPAPDLVQGHGPPSSHSPLIQSNFTTSLGVN